MDRWVINRLVPSEAGMLQLWVMEGRSMELLVTEPTYYGGLRNTLREVIDELAPSGNRLRKLIDGRECWFRFSLCPVKEYLQDLKKWFGEGEIATDKDDLEILVNEKEELRKFPLPPPDIQQSGRRRMNDSDFGPKMPEPKRTGYGPEIPSADESLPDL